MAKQVITQDQVVSYLRQNRPDPIPTLRKLRDIFGGGSIETISRGVRAYQEEQTKTAHVRRPDDFSDQVSRLEDPLWDLLRPLIAAAEEKTKARLQAEITTAKEAAAELESECEDLRRKDEARAEQLDRCISEVGKLGRQLASTQAKLEAAQDTTTNLLQEISSLRTQLQTAETERAKAEGALEAYRRAMGDSV